MVNLKKGLLLSLAAAMVAVGGVGCKSKEKPIQTTFSEPTNTTPATTDTGGNALPAWDVASMPWAAEPALRTIYFDYDSDVLRPDAVQTLSGNLNYIQNNPTMAILIEGHCDERGTQEYNLALGERRALAVREYLIRLGVPAYRIGTLSFGEERPSVMGGGEAAWSQNRRGEFKVAPLPQN